MTFLFTDIQGSTQLFRRLGDDFIELLEFQRALISEAVIAHGGVVVRPEGDALFCAFADPAAAVHAATEAQQQLQRHQWPNGGSVQVRMGLHTGRAQVIDGDYLAMAVHQAARVSDAAHGGQILVSDATHARVADVLNAELSLRLVGRYRLRDFPDPEPLYQVHGPDLPEQFGPIRAQPIKAHNVPQQLTVFVGRETAMAELAELATTRRLVTVLGTGGVGKTRLALEVVPRLVEAFPDGIWLIQLAQLPKGSQVASEVAGVLNVRADAQRGWLEPLVEACASKRMLLVLDNCEHVLDSVCETVLQLIAGCPGVNLVTTSREPLGLAIEQRFHIAPLSVPRDFTELNVRESEAVALFLERTHSVDPDLDLSREMVHVGEICRRLDGLPLAIELAAARTAALPLATIATRLADKLDVLGTERRKASPHQETLLRSIEWSYDLLDEPERVLFRRLGVFADEFGLDPVEAICGPAPGNETTIELLARLVEKSLVQRASDRFRLLDPLSSFAREQLQEAGELAELRAKHLSYYTGVVTDCAGRSSGPEQQLAYDRLDADLAEIRAAVQFALDRSNPAALELAAALGQFGFVRNRLGEVGRWCIDAAAIPGAPPAARAAAVSQAAWAHLVLGAPTRAREMAVDAVALAREANEPKPLLNALLMLTEVLLECELTTEAQKLTDEVNSLAEEVGDEWTRGVSKWLTARAHEHERGYAWTDAQLSDALESFRRLGDRRQQGRVLMSIATAALRAGELNRADRAARRCAQIAGEIGHPIGQAIADTVRIWVAVDRDQVDVANNLLAEVAEVARSTSYIGVAANCVAAATAVRLAEGHIEEAARLLGALEASTEPGVDDSLLEVRGRLKQLRAELSSRLSDDVLDSLLDDGARIGLTDAIS